MNENLGNYNRVLNKNHIVDSDEIDLVQLFFKLIQKWEIIFLGMLVGCILGFIYQQYIVTPEYSATTMIYMRSGNKTLSVQDLTLSQNLNSDYEIIFKTRSNLENVIEDLDLEYTSKQLKDNVSIEAVDDTRIIMITVTDINPKLASDIANKVAEYGMEIVKEVDTQVPFVIESAIVPEQPITIGLNKALAIGGLLGAILVTAVIIFLSIVNDQVESEEDLESSFGIPVLSVVIEDKKFEYEKTNSKKRKGLHLWKSREHKKA